VATAEGKRLDAPTPRLALKDELCTMHHGNDDSMESLLLSNFFEILFEFAERPNA
jgi:hypothetical protein